VVVCAAPLIVLSCQHTQGYDDSDLFDDNDVHLVGYTYFLLSRLYYVSFFPWDSMVLECNLVCFPKPYQRHIVPYRSYTWIQYYILLATLPCTVLPIGFTGNFCRRFMQSNCCGNCLLLIVNFIIVVDCQYSCLFWLCYLE
jgi:hypothetical protein